MHISGLRGIHPGKVTAAAFKEFNANEMTTYAAALSYQALFSLFPFFIFIVALVSTLHLPDFVDWLRRQAEYFAPQQAMATVNTALNKLEQPQGGLLSLSALIALWTASAGVRAVMNALNAAYGVEEGRPAWKLYPLSIVYTIVIAALLLLAAAFMLLGPQAIQWLAQQVGLEHAFVLLWAWLRLPLALALMISAVALVYYVAPNVQQRFRLITPGAVVAVIIWVGASLAFDYCARNLSNYDAMYGSIGAVIVLLLYFYISAAVLLLGAEINAVIEHQAPEGKAPGEKRMS